jgi:hypothetical protein
LEKAKVKECSSLYTTNCGSIRILLFPLLGNSHEQRKKEERKEEGKKFFYLFGLVLHKFSGIQNLKNFWHPPVITYRSLASNVGLSTVFFMLEGALAPSCPPLAGGFGGW